ncbi:MAG: sensor histidine kinase [Planctomycetota bacterium]
MYNTVVLQVLNHLTRTHTGARCPKVKKVINFQISADLLALTVLLHYSGGVENPFVFFFVFHVIIASILLSVRDSYLQATFAVLLFGLLILLEYKQMIPHDCLTGFVSHCSYEDRLCVLGTFLVFATTLYLVVYMAGHIATRLRRAEKAQRKANLLLQAKDHIKDEYVLRVTHDIKGHLATIQSCLSVVANKILGPLDSRQAEFINTAHTRTVRLLHFVKTLLKLTEMRLSDNFDVKTKADDKSITLQYNVEPSADKVFGNQFSIEEVVTNLLLNAIKYTPGGGTVSIGATNHSDCVQVQVADTGIGIPEEEQPKIFDEFYRATNAKMLERDGTGLGLSIVKHIVERHRGEISVESKQGIGKQGIGTTFRLTLPRESCFENR